MGTALMVSRLGTDVQHSAGVPQVVAPTALAELGEGVYQEIAGRIVEPDRRGVTEGWGADEPDASGLWTAKIAASMFDPTTNGLDAEFFRQIPISVVKTRKLEQLSGKTDARDELLLPGGRTECVRIDDRIGCFLNRRERSIARKRAVTQDAADVHVALACPRPPNPAVDR